MIYKPPYSSRFEIKDTNVVMTSVYFKDFDRTVHLGKHLYTWLGAAPNDWESYEEIIDALRVISELNNFSTGYEILETIRIRI